MIRALLFLVSLSLAASSTAAAPRDSLDAEARDYVRLQLGTGEKEEGYLAAQVERFGSAAARWRRFEQLISQPTLPSDLKGVE